MPRLVDPADELTHDEFDATLIVDWLESYMLAEADDEIPPAPTSARQGELKWAHDNVAAWRLVDESVLSGYGLTGTQAYQLMANHM